MTLVCVPIMVRDLDSALADVDAARDAGADLVEFRIDEVFHGEGDAEGEGLALSLVERSALPCIITCRPTWDGGEYDGDESARISLFERLGTSDHPPRYIDVELAAYTRSANIRQKVNLAVDPRGRDRHSSLILSIHDFEGRPADLSRKLAAAYAEPAASVVKVAYRARSLRDNLELFDVLREAPKPTIALGMSEFGLMSRVLAPKFGGFLTFASLHKQSTTAPGQPTVAELLGQYRFRSIGRDTRVYGVIGWPVGHSMGPLIHNAGFEAVGWDGVYLPLPVAAVEGDEEGSYASFKATIIALETDESLGFEGASVTMPHKANLVRFAKDEALGQDLRDVVAIDQTGAESSIGVANTIVMHFDAAGDTLAMVQNTDAFAIRDVVRAVAGDIERRLVCVVGAGGVARAAAFMLSLEKADVVIVNRSPDRAQALVDALASTHIDPEHTPRSALELPREAAVYINCTPVGMAGGPNPDGVSIPVDDIRPAPETVFFDTVYNPIETPLLKAAKRWGCRTIDGVEMFVRQAALQFELWTGTKAPAQLFDRLVRERLS